MDEIRKSEIIYEEGWRQRVPEPEKSIENDSSEPVDEAVSVESVKLSGGAVILTLQLVICILLAIVALLMSSMGSGAYKSFSDWFREELQKPLISHEAFSAVDDTLFKNRAQASADEAEAR